MQTLIGGRIVHIGTWRVEGVLAVTRAIGDRRLKKYVCSAPEISERKLTEDDEYLILASDGVWDVMSSQDAVDVIKVCGCMCVYVCPLNAKGAWRCASQSSLTVGHHVVCMLL